MADDWPVEKLHRHRDELALRYCPVHLHKAKLMMGTVNKADKLDVHGMNRLPRNRTLPTARIPTELRLDLECRLQQLPAQACWVSERLLAPLDFVQQHVVELEDRLEELLASTRSLADGSLPSLSVQPCRLLAAVRADEGRDI